ncbi:hypothetical protein J6590_003929 [Homalodisca vitripennis]|nr:hypothetical protein J6590_003929 [Homalodisca vitripennis]
MRTSYRTSYSYAASLSYFPRVIGIDLVNGIGMGEVNVKKIKVTSKRFEVWYRIRTLFSERLLRVPDICFPLDLGSIVISNNARIARKRIKQDIIWKQLELATFASTLYRMYEAHRVWRSLNEVVTSLHVYVDSHTTALSSCLDIAVVVATRKIRFKLEKKEFYSKLNKKLKKNLISPTRRARSCSAARSLATKFKRKNTTRAIRTIIGTLTCMNGHLPYVVSVGGVGRGRGRWGGAAGIYGEDPTSAYHQDTMASLPLLALVQEIHHLFKNMLKN